MIKSFMDVNPRGDCEKFYPDCLHGPFRVELKDGRVVVGGLAAAEVRSILKDLKDIGVIHQQWRHFSESKNLEYRGWATVSSSEILTNIFNEVISPR